MVLMKMLMEMTPLRREECWWWRWRWFPPSRGKFPRQDHRAGALDWFCSSSASWRRRFLPKASSWFFLGRNPPYSKIWEPEGQQGAHKPPSRGQGGRPRLAGLWSPGGSPPVLLPPSIFYKIQNNSSLIFATFGVAQNRYLKLAAFFRPEFQLPAFSLFM